jgi:hypothetical protein
MDDYGYDDEPIDCSERQNRKYGSYHAIPEKVNIIEKHQEWLV